jgi:cyclin-dependent kinase 12/13
MAIKRYGISKHVYIVLEFMEHDLAGLLGNPSIHFTSSQIKLYLRQILEGIEYMHDNKVIHRDLKASNVLINNSGELKLCDFGLSKSYNHGDRLTNNVITLHYRPPELILGDTLYDESVDMWSYGCIVAEMFTKRPILTGRTDIEQIDKIYRLCGTSNTENFHKLPKYYEFEPKRKHKRMVKEKFEKLPEDVRDLIDRLLVMEPSKRLTAKEALQHSYFSNDPKMAVLGTLPVLSSSYEYLSKKQQIEIYKSGKRESEW